VTHYKFNYSPVMASRTVSFLAGSIRSSAYLTVQITCLPTYSASILSNKKRATVLRILLLWAQEFQQHCVY